MLFKQVEVHAITAETRLSRDNQISFSEQSVLASLGLEVAIKLATVKKAESAGSVTIIVELHAYSPEQIKKVKETLQAAIDSGAYWAIVLAKDIEKQLDLHE